jgi:hypothetical protein
MVDSLRALAWEVASLVAALLMAGCSTSPHSQAASPSLETASGQTASTLVTAMPAPGSVTVAPTSTPGTTATRRPSATPMPSAAPSRTSTPSPSPTRTATATPTQTHTPTPAPTATPRPPTETPTPSATPTPSVDFRLVSWRLWSKEANGGCEKGMHNIFIVTLDAAGQPLSNIVVGDTWNNTEETTGRPGKEAGRTDIPLYANTMEIYAKRDAVTGQPYSSEASPPCASYITTIPDEQLVQAGYFSNEIESQWNRENNGYACGGHFSW